MKTCEQAVPMAEVRELMSTARSYLSEGNLSPAFDLAQEASQLLQQVRNAPLFLGIFLYEKHERKLFLTFILKLIFSAI